MPYGSYLTRRLLSGLVTLFGITLVVFLMVRLVPGDPARVLLGPHATAQEIATLHAEWGLNRPIWIQYGLYVKRVVTGNLGSSLFYQIPVSQLIGERLPPTLYLMAFSAVLALIIALPLATLAALRRDRLADHIVRVFSQIGLSVPAVWLGLILITLISVKAHALPVGGYGTGAAAHFRSLILPSLTIALSIFPTLTRSLRASLIVVLDSDYIASARARGLSWPRVVIVHGIRNAIPPTVTVLGLNIGYLVGSTVAVETIFALPGLGSLMIQAVLSRDFPVVQGVAIVYGVLVLVINLATDLTHTALEPRLVEQ
jgi:peptide/nickel transport system permease protein